MKNINYTKAQENQMRELSPITYDIAVELGETFGKKLRSVIAKACSLDGVEYIPRKRGTKNGDESILKNELVARISKALGQEMKGLEKATKASLNLLMASVEHTNREAHDDIR